MRHLCLYEVPGLGEFLALSGTIVQSPGPGDDFTLGYGVGYLYGFSGLKVLDSAEVEDGKVLALLSPSQVLLQLVGCGEEDSGAFPSPCTCSTVSLMQVGCTCGGT